MPPIVLLPAGYGRVGKGSEYIMVTRSTWKCLLFLVARFTSQLWVDAFPAWFTSVRRSDDCLFRKYSDRGGAEVGFDKPHQPKNHSTSYPAIGVTLKMAFDSSPVWGVADLSETKSERFTSPASLELVHRLRRLSDCVLVGKGTLDRDNCTLTVRRVPLTKDRPRQPIRVVLDPALTLVKNHPQRKYEIFQDGLATIVYYSSSSVFDNTYNFLTKECEIKREQEAYTAKIWNENVTLIDASVLEVKSSPVESRRYISPKQILQDLATRGVHHIMVEGGPKTALAFLNEKMVDRAILIRAPLVFQKPLVSNISHASLENAGLQMIHEQTDAYGDTVEYWTRRGLSWPCEDITSWP